MIEGSKNQSEMMIEKLANLKFDKRPCEIKLKVFNKRELSNRMLKEKNNVKKEN